MNRDKVFIIGGGPSCKDFDFTLLKNENTIAVNYAAKNLLSFGFSPTYYLTADSGVIIKSVYADFWNMKTTTVVVMGREHPNYKRAKGYLRDFDIRIHPFRTDTGKIGFDYDRFVTGKNSGFCALQFAVLKGYNNIYLLGFDLSKDDEGNKYWYPNVSGNNSPYDIFLKHFITGVNEIHTKSKLKVFLSSKPSRLEPYMQFVSREEALK